MAYTDRPLLTIAIPTYNRANLLRTCLSKLTESILGYEHLIEVIVSDNCSTDDTELVVREMQAHYPYKYFKNSENLGFNYNYIKLVDDYAIGDYCWVIGDDDFLYPHAIKAIVEVLSQDDNLDVIYAGFDFKLESEISKNIQLKTVDNQSFLPRGSLMTFNKLVSDVGTPGNLMLTFISSIIFRTSLMKAIDKNLISKESWTSFYNLFPHSYLYARMFDGNSNAYVFETPLIIAVVHEKAWDSKLRLLYLKFMPELHSHYLALGYNKELMRNQEKLIIAAGTPYLFLHILSDFELFKIKLNFLAKYILDPVLYSSLLGGLQRRLNRSSN